MNTWSVLYRIGKVYMLVCSSSWIRVYWVITSGKNRRSSCHFFNDLLMTATLWVLNNGIRPESLHRHPRMTRCRSPVMDKSAGSTPRLARRYAESPGEVARRGAYAAICTVHKHFIYAFNKFWRAWIKNIDFGDSADIGKSLKTLEQ